MRVTVKAGILFALLWFIIKVVLFVTGNSLDTFKISVLLNMLFAIMAISFGLYFQKRKDTDSNLLRDIKNGLTAGIPYSILLTLFIYTYYNKIDTHYIKHQIAEREVTLDKDLANPERLALAKKANPDYEVMSIKQIKRKEMSKLEGIFNAKSAAIISLSALLLYSTINSIIIAIILRKIVFRE